MVPYAYKIIFQYQYLFKKLYFLKTVKNKTEKASQINLLNNKYRIFSIRFSHWLIYQTTYNGNKSDHVWKMQ
jgi:hypothetical protein